MTGTRNYVWCVISLNIRCHGNRSPQQIVIHSVIFYTISNNVFITRNLMAELYIIGQIIGAKNFLNKSLFCKWGIQSGDGWKIIAGQKDGQTQVDYPGYDDTTYWCHPIDIHFATKGVPGWPKLYLQVYHFDQFGRSEICGYGYTNIPTTPGTHKIECPTWKPIGRLYDKFAEFFIGGGPQLRNIDIIYSGFDRYRLSTEPMGVVLIELNLIHKNFQKYGVETY